ncbi:MAG: flagellar motor stator protein MotA [Pseudomonadota bacterium]
MFVIIGIVVVIGCVLGGFLEEGGNPATLIIPSELLIIFGAATGAFLISSPKHVVTATLSAVGGLFKAKSYTKAQYLDILGLLYQLFSKMRREGMIGIESDIEHPDKSEIFKKYGSIMGNSGIVKFICDNLKVVITGAVQANDLETLMEMEIDIRKHHMLIPAHSISKIADGLPGLGIVAAVLGVVLTMGKISEPPEVLGHSIGAALVGTFLGVLMCYGFVGPMGTNLEHQADDASITFQVIKTAFVSYVGGAPPQLAVEFGRRAIPGHEKPDFGELEAFLKKAREK